MFTSILQKLGITPAVFVIKAVDLIIVGLGLYQVAYNQADPLHIFGLITIIMICMLVIGSNVNEYSHSRIGKGHDARPFDIDEEPLKQFLFKSLNSRTLSISIYEGIQSVYRGFRNAVWEDTEAENIKEGYYATIIVYNGKCGVTRGLYKDGEWHVSGRTPVADIDDYKFVAFDKKTYQPIKVNIEQLS